MHKYVYSWMNDFHGIESINLDKYYLVVISVNFIRPKIQLKQNTTALEEQFDESMMKFKGIWENYPFFEMITYDKIFKKFIIWKIKKLKCFGRGGFICYHAPCFKLVAKWKPRLNSGVYNVCQKGVLCT